MAVVDAQPLRAGSMVAALAKVISRQPHKLYVFLDGGYANGSPVIHLPTAQNRDR